MKLYITYTKNSFTMKQIEELNEVFEVVFLEDVFLLEDAPYIADDQDKVLMVDPDWYDWNITAEHLSQIKNLKAIMLSTTAYDWIDLEYCKKNNILVVNIPKYSTDSVAEYAVFLMMSLAKKLPIQIKGNYEVNYELDMLTTEIANKTAGIIGLGTIGSKIADLCAGLGMNIIYWNRKDKDTKYRKVDIDTLFKEADFLFPAFSTNDETRNLITDDLINGLHNQSFINVVNDAREIYNHELLLKKCKEDNVSYAFEIYDGKTINDFEGNVMATAPYAFYTKEAIDRLVDIWCKNTIDFMKGSPNNVIE